MLINTVEPHPMSVSEEWSISQLRSFTHASNSTVPSIPTFCPWNYVEGGNFVKDLESFITEKYTNFLFCEQLSNDYSC
jgi:hypothetical protein